MYLIFNKMMKFYYVHIPNCNGLLERLAGLSIVQGDLPAFGKIGLFQKVFDLFFCRTLKYRRRDINTKLLCGPSEMNLEYLPDIHS
ncbi:hypothetical protein BMS3Bbin09_00297 [bacterium BMS3Bbin09]|nr:hypothetical protein BMS3Bbin09_00297 [bacterium BMS3Bbin09]